MVGGLMGGWKTSELFTWAIFRVAGGKCGFVKLKVESG